MRIKDNTINPRGITNELLLGITISSMVYQKYGYCMRITSLCDGKHSATHSNHYGGNGADLGSKELRPEHKHRILNEIKRKLNNQYKIILENEGKVMEHFHLAYKPKYQSN